MLRTITYIFCLVIVFSIFSCSSNESQEASTSTTSVENTYDTDERQEAEYPEFFKELGIPQFEDTYVLSSKRFANSKNKYGAQSREETDGEFETVKNAVISQLEANNWIRNTKRDKRSTPEQENDGVPVKYFVTNFQKDKYFLMVNITTANNERTTITKIVKEM